MIAWNVLGLEGNKIVGTGLTGHPSRQSVIAPAGIWPVAKVCYTVLKVEIISCRRNLQYSAKKYPST